MANSVDPDQTAPIGEVCSGSTLFASILNSSVKLRNFLLQQTTSADVIFQMYFFLGALVVKPQTKPKKSNDNLICFISHIIGFIFLTLSIFLLQNLE